MLTLRCSFIPDLKHISDYVSELRKLICRVEETCDRDRILSLIYWPNFTTRTKPDRRPKPETKRYSNINERVSRAHIEFWLYHWAVVQSLPCSFYTFGYQEFDRYRDDVTEIRPESRHRPLYFKYRNSGRAHLLGRSFCNLWYLLAP